MTPKKTDEQGRTVLQVERGKKGAVLRDLKHPPKKKGKKKRKAQKRQPDDRMQLQIRVGEKLIKNLDAAVAWKNYLRPDAEEDTRTSLACDAIQKRLNGSNWEHGRTTADVLVGNRKPLLVRVPRQMMHAIDLACEEESVTRTVWVLDALLAELAQVKADVDKAPQATADAA